MKKPAITVIIAAFLIIPLQITAADSQRFPALDVDIGTRAVGMGGAFTGIAQDASAMYWNPAGLANVNMIEADLAYDKWILDSSFQYANAALPVGYGTIAAEFMYMDFGSFEQRDNYGVDLNKSLSSSNIIGGIGYGCHVADFMSAGIAAKFVNLAIDTENISGILLDIGLLARTGDIFTFGLDLQNIDFGSGSMAPGNIRIGAGAHILNTDTHDVLADADADYSGAFGASFSLAQSTQYTGCSH